MSKVQLEIDNLVATLWLNDPQRLNAMDEAMAKDFEQAVIRLKQEKLRCLVIRGRGSSFSAGGDLEMLLGKNKKSYQENVALMLKFYRSFLGVLDLPYPVIAVLHGYAVGAGFCLSCACDMRVGSRDCKLGAPFAALGLYPGMGGSYFVEKRLGSTGEMMMLTGQRIDGQRAHQLGFFEGICEEQELDQHLAKLTSRIAKMGPKAITQLLTTLRPKAEFLEEVLLREADQQSKSYTQEEFVEGVTALIEKREPRFDG